ncbi:MAG: hypothetical protein ACI4HI_18145 [Lachnospiraceae bacterium]
MMSKTKIFNLAGFVLLVAAAIFFVFALNHPEMSFPWPNMVTYMLYVLYFVVTVSMFVAAKICKGNDKK